MNEKRLIDLDVTDSLNGYILHVSGEILHNPGDKLTLEHLALMEKCGIQSVFLLEKDEDLGSFVKKAKQGMITTERIMEGEVTPVALFDEQGVKIVDDGHFIDSAIIQKLHENNITNLYFEKSGEELGVFECEKYQNLIQSGSVETIGSIATVEHPRERKRKEEEQKRKDEAKQYVQELSDFISGVQFDESLMFLSPAKEVSESGIKDFIKEQDSLRRKPQPPSLCSVLTRFVEIRPPGATTTFSLKYEQWTKQVQEIFDNLKLNKQVQFETIDQIAKEIVVTFTNDDNLFLAGALRKGTDTKESLAIHSVNVCIYTVALAATAGYNATQLVELAYGALLHDVGHVATPKSLFTSEKLDGPEQRKFDSHTIYGLAFLKKLSKIPRSTACIIYQHHERMNGAGVPNKTEGASIHDFAKMVAVADTVVSGMQREAPLAAIKNAVALAQAKQLDLISLKALLITVSVYPVGSVVLITGNLLAKVIGVNGSNMQKPVVRALFRLDGQKILKLDQAVLVDMASQKEIVVLKDVTNSVKLDQFAGF